MTEQRVCQNCKTKFTIEADDFDFYKKIDVPPPTWCPECRMVRRMMFRNERVLYRDSCDVCKQPTFSMYSPDISFTVHCRQCWYGNAWDPLSYGAAYNWQQPFFEQYKELFERVPKIALAHYHTNVAADYANFVADSKNIYLAFSVINNSENVFYSWSVDTGKNCCDCLSLNSAELCYQNVEGARNYQSAYLLRSRDCLSAAFLFDCVNCQDCFMSSNLRNKRFVMRNKQLNREEYATALTEVNMGAYSETKKLQQEFATMVTQSLHKFGNITRSIHCTGNDIENSKNAQHTFTAHDSENLKFAFRAIGSKDAYDITGLGESELLYEGVAGGFGSYVTKFCTFANATGESAFTDWCHDSSRVFGCVGVRNKSYCILNKQYTKEEYDALVPKIIKHMNDMPYVDKLGREYRYGEFFPPELSPFAYNETIAQEYFPLTKAEAEQKGYRWRDPDAKSYAVTKEPSDLPDHIKDTDDSILQETIGCAHIGTCNEQCTTAFKVIPEELSFYRRMNLPLPRLCPNCRHYQRLKQRNPLKLWHRSCMCAGERSQDGRYQNTVKHFHETNACPNEFETSYAPERPEIVYCEQCYNAEVV